MIMRWCNMQTKRIRLSDHHRLRNIGNKTQLSQKLYADMKQLAEYDGPTISEHARKNMTTMGKTDTSDLMMIIKWFTTKSSGPPKLEFNNMGADAFSYLHKSRLIISPIINCPQGGLEAILKCDFQSCFLIGTLWSACDKAIRLMS